MTCFNFKLCCYDLSLTIKYMAKGYGLMLCYNVKFLKHSTILIYLANNKVDILRRNFNQKDYVV
jgi:hypothetical protein